MAQEVEPTIPDAEHNADKGELFKQEWIVEGLVVAAINDFPQYIVTKIITGHDTLYPGEYRFAPLHSPDSSQVLAPEDFTEYSYRGLVTGGHYYFAEDGHKLDQLLKPNTELQIGDRIRVVRWSQQVPYEYDVYGGGKATHMRTEEFEDVSVIESGVDIKQEEDQALERKQFIRKNFAGILRRLERLELNQRERLETDVEAAIAWKRWVYKGGGDFMQADFTYGEAPIKDHFVSVKAEPFVSNEGVPLGGDMRFTTSGHAFLARDITAGSTSKELALYQEPMVELTARVWTDTVFNPAVNGMTVDFVIDGVRYAGTKDIELSTNSFRNSGHHLHFNTFTAPGDGYDGVEIKPDESDAILKYKSLVRNSKSRVARLAIEAKGAQKELGEGSSSNIVSVQSQIQELELAREKAFEDLRPIINEISSRPPDAKFGGVRLLVPRNKLDGVRVVIGRKDGRSNPDQ